VRVNGRLAEINGAPAAAHIGRTLAEMVPDMPPEVAGDLRRVLDRGERLTEVQVSGRTPATPGRREWLVTYWPVREGATVTGAGCVVFDVTERRTAQRELRAQTDRYEALLLALSEAGQGMLVVEEDGRAVYANAAFEHLSGYPFPELNAMESVLEIVVPEHRADARRRTMLRFERGLVDTEYQVTIERRDGALVDLEVVGVPLHVDGHDRMVVVARDVTDRRRIEAERECRMRRSALLAEASDLFDQTLDEAGTLQRLARLCVRELADTCVVVLGEGPGAIRRVAAAASDPELERTLLELQLRYPVDEEPVAPLAEALRTGRVQVVGPITADAIAAGTTDERHGDLIRSIRPTSALMVPLRARGSVRGALALGFRSLAGQDRDEMIALFEDLGRRAALALDTARLYEERAAVARTLQRSLLPPTLPEVPGMDIAARYLPAGEGSEVGGDFYDCFPTGDGEWVVVIGDVCGRGVEAAAITALARHTIRAAVVHDPEPAAVLSALNDAILLHDAEDRFCSALYVRLIPCVSGVEARVATGGHPLPLALRSCGTVEVVGRPGTLLGVVREPEISSTDVRLQPGDALVLFTDGVIGASRMAGTFGPEQLADFLGGFAGEDAGRIAAGVERRVLELQSGRPRDDVAVMVLRVPPGAPASFAPESEGVAARS
jgi:PAS domain S-box-containing protein